MSCAFLRVLSAGRRNRIRKAGKTERNWQFRPSNVEDVRAGRLYAGPAAPDRSTPPLPAHDVREQGLAAFAHVRIGGVEIPRVPGVGDVAGTRCEIEQTADLGLRIIAQDAHDPADVRPVHADDQVEAAIVGPREPACTVLAAADADFLKLAAGSAMHRVASSSALTAAEYYKSVYRIIGVVILGIGLCLIPFLPHLIKGAYPEDVNLATLYLIYLVNTAISYFLFAYKSSLLVVHQRDDVNSSINTVLSLGLTGSQIAVLLITRNYYFFSLLMPLFTIANNVLIGWRTRVMFPQYKADGDLEAETRAGIKKLVSGTFIQQTCYVTRNSLDSICISAFLGLTLTAIYNNYYTILNGLISSIGIFTVAFTGGVGIHVASRSVEENFQELKKLDFVYLWISGWCAICLLCLYQPFMEIWMGKNMMLPMSAVVLFCMYFYLLTLSMS